MPITGGQGGRDSNNDNMVSDERAFLLNIGNEATDNKRGREEMKRDKKLS